MKDIDQQIIKFNYEQNYKNEDYYISKSNNHIINIFDKWPKWEKNFLNISGEKYSGKTHLTNIFLYTTPLDKLTFGTIFCILRYIFSIDCAIFSVAVISSGSLRSCCILLSSPSNIAPRITTVN